MTRKLPAWNQIGNGQHRALVLPGVPSDFLLFEPMVRCLDGATFTYVFPDYRGFGQSRELEGRFSFAELTEDMLAIADHLDWFSFHVVGHSFGGIVAQRLALDAPHRVQSLVVIAAPGSGFSP